MAVDDHDFVFNHQTAFVVFVDNKVSYYFFSTYFFFFTFVCFEFN